LQTGESLTTGNGKAEVLLTPGVFLRVGSDSLVKMISPSLTNTDVSLEHVALATRAYTKHILESLKAVSPSYFDPKVLERLALIALGRSAGFSLDEIALMFAPDGRPRINRQVLEA
jgi:hypothetical protein